MALPSVSAMDAQVLSVGAPDAPTPSIITVEQRMMLAELARQEYDKFTREDRQRVQEMWRAMDADGDGTVTMEEAARFFHATLSDKEGPEEADQFAKVLMNNWNLIDANGDGTLDMYELGALLMLTEGILCDTCNTFVLDAQVWACPTCWTQFLALSRHERCTRGELLATVCVRCHDAAGSTAKCWYGHAMELVANEWRVPRQDWAFSQDLLSRPGARVTCECCADVHDSNAAGYYQGGPHVFGAGEGGGFFCEWCVKWSCSACSANFKDTANPSVGRWAGKWKCSDCKELGDRTVDRAGLMAMANDPHRAHCLTCRPRLRDGSFNVARTMEAAAELLSRQRQEEVEEEVQRKQKEVQQQAEAESKRQESEAQAVKQQQSQVVEQVKQQLEAEQQKQQLLLLQQQQQTTLLLLLQQQQQQLQQQQQQLQLLQEQLQVKPQHAKRGGPSVTLCSIQ